MHIERHLSIGGVEAESSELERDGADLHLMRDTVGYLADYVGQFHRVREDLAVEAVAVRQPRLRACVALLDAQHDALELDGAELHHRLGLAIRDEAVRRDGLVHIGFLYCTELRRHMSLEETTLEGAAIEAPVSSPATRDGEEHYRALFEDLTRRVGCDCTYSS